MAASRKTAATRVVAAVGGSLAADERVVRVRLPRALAFDLRKFQLVQASILDRLGCQACCSGFDIRWEFARDFAVDEQLKVTELVAGGVVTEG